MPRLVGQVSNLPYTSLWPLANLPTGSASDRECLILDLILDRVRYNHGRPWEGIISKKKRITAVRSARNRARETTCHNGSRHRNHVPFGAEMGRALFELLTEHRVGNCRRHLAGGLGHRGADTC